jgi:hypothetical protein
MPWRDWQGVWRVLESCGGLLLQRLNPFDENAHPIGIWQMGSNRWHLARPACAEKGKKYLGNNI